MTPREPRANWCATTSTICRLLNSMGGLRRRLWVVYPPGIATIVPGERLTERARPMIDYLKMFEKSANVFPGFEAEVQGLYREVDASGRDPVLYLCGPRAVRLNGLVRRKRATKTGRRPCRKPFTALRPRKRVVNSASE